MCNFPKTSHVCLLAGRSVMISSKVWKFHFNAPFGALVFENFIRDIQMEQRKRILYKESISRLFGFLLNKHGRTLRTKLSGLLLMDLMVLNG